MNTTPGTQSQSLKGPTIFVYVISILAGLAAGGIVTAISWSNGEILIWPDIMGHVALIVGPLSGIVAAWFWTSRMKRCVNSLVGPVNILIFGTLWGLFAGWIASVLLWIVEGAVMAGTAYKHFWEEFPISAGIGVGVCGSIGGLGAGIICGVVWAIWTRPKQQ